MVGTKQVTMCRTCSGYESEVYIFERASKRTRNKRLLRMFASITWVLAAWLLAVGWRGVCESILAGGADHVNVGCMGGLEETI